MSSQYKQEINFKNFAAEEFSPYFNLFVEERRSRKKHSKKCHNLVHAIRNESNVVKRMLEYFWRKGIKIVDKHFFNSDREELAKSYIENYSKEDLSNSTRQVHYGLIKFFFEFLSKRPEIYKSNKRKKNCWNLVDLFSEEHKRWNNLKSLESKNDNPEYKKREVELNTGEDTSRKSKKRKSNSGKSKRTKGSKKNQDEENTEDETEDLPESMDPEDSLDVSSTNNTLFRKISAEEEVPGNYKRWNDFLNDCGLSTKNSERYSKLMDEERFDLRDLLHLDDLALKFMDLSDRVKIVRMIEKMQIKPFHSPF